MQHKRKQHFVCYIDFPEDVCPAHLGSLSNHGTEHANYHVMLYWPICNLREFEQLWVFSGWILVRPKVALNTLTSPFRPVFLLTLSTSRQMTTACEEKSAANFTREVGEQSSVSERFDVCAGIYYCNMVDCEFHVCSRTCCVGNYLFTFLDKSCVLFAWWTETNTSGMSISRIPWATVSFLRKLKALSVPKYIYFLFICFSVDCPEGRFRGHVYIRANSLSTTERWLIRLTLTCFFRISRYTERNVQVAEVELWIDT